MKEDRPINHALLVDDEPEICALLTAMLKRIGTECLSVHSLEDGRKAIQEKPFDIVFLDVHLPDGLGYDLIPEIKRDRPGTQVLAISAIEQERERAVEAGADDFVPKPFNRSSIFTSMRDLGFRSAQ